jgi:chromosomal replication initiation ATPase DnaA
MAVLWIDRYPNWGSHALLVHGPKGCGKTHLSHMFAKEHLNAEELSEDLWPKTERLVVENIDRLTNERALCHLFNWTKEQKIGLLMTSNHVPQFRLPDLSSRIMMCPKVPILPPDDELIYAVLSKAFSDRGIAVDATVLEYATRYTERTFEAVQALIDMSDKLSLSQNRRITIPIIKQVLADLRVIRRQNSMDDMFDEPTLFD